MSITVMSSWRVTVYTTYEIGQAGKACAQSCTSNVHNQIPDCCQGAPSIMSGKLNQEIRLTQDLTHQNRTSRRSRKLLLQFFPPYPMQNDPMALHSQNTVQCSYKSPDDITGCTAAVEHHCHHPKANSISTCSVVLLTGGHPVTGTNCYNTADESQPTG